MKKDFSQPFEKTSTHDISVFTQLSHDGNLGNRFVLERFEDDPQEYIPIRVETKSGADDVSSIAAALYKKGLVLTYLRKVMTGTDICFAFTDDTPGTIDSVICYYAKVDITQQQDDLAYITPEEFASFVNTASFFETTEVATAKQILYQID